MPPQRTAQGIASTSKPKLAKSKASAASTSAPASAVSAAAGGGAETLPQVDLPASFSRAQAGKAVDALLSHAAKVAAEKEETELMPREEHVWLCVALKRGASKKKVSPVRIQLPHPALPPPPATSICLLTKDPQREYKDLLDAQGVKFVSRVVGVDKLKGKFKPFEARRQLMKEHDMFLCDERVVGMMPGLLGKIFYEAKKLPIAVNLRKKDLKTELANAVNSTYFVPTTGTNVSIRIATPAHTSPSATLQNLLTALPPIIAQLEGGWDNVLSLGIKTSSSVLLPVWSSALAGRFDQPAAAAAQAEAAEAKAKKEKRKSVFDEWAQEEKEETERAKRYLVENGEAPEEDDDEEEQKAAQEKKKGKKSKKAAVPAVEAVEAVSDDEDEGDAAMLDVDADGDESASEAAAVAEPEPESKAMATPAAAPTKKVMAGAPAPKKAGKKVSSSGGVKGSLKAGVLGKSKKGRA